ncbi:MAG: chromosomal replication initiator protein DnaA [Candidatus Brocadiales bacterium]
MKLIEDFFWQTFLEEIKKIVTPQQFQTWFTSLIPLAYSNNHLDIQVPNIFFKEWLEKHYIGYIQKAMVNVTQSIPTIKLHIEKANSRVTNPAPLEESDTNSAIGGRLNKEYRFENFIVGSCNRLAHAASFAVAETPGQAYNPLFIHASPGLGKTHLLHAICLSLIERHSPLKIVYLPCEAFMNHFILTIKTGNWEAFRQYYRDIDILAIDDIHFLAHSQRTREEFFHTFNALHNSQKQIILSSDCPPEEIPTLEERLVSRFKWGLMCSISSPAYETKIAIIEKKAGAWGVELPTDVVRFLAESITTNIREIEGAIVKIVKYASITNSKITIGLAQECISELVKNKKPISIEQIFKVITSKYNIHLSLLQSKKRMKSISFPRQIAMHLARRLTSLSLNEIGGYLGGRDHTTVMHADDKIHSLRKRDRSLNELLQKIEAGLQKQENFR